MTWPQTQIEKNPPFNRIFSYNKYLHAQKPKRALLSYLTDAVISEFEGGSSLRFSNYGIAVAWARCLNQLGYLVDIINFNDTKFKPTSHYDLAVLHGAQNLESLMSNLVDTTIIHFTTGSYWKFNNSSELTRLANFEKRNGIKPPADRFITASEDPLNRLAAGVIGIGNSFTRTTYKSHKNVEMINNATYPDKKNRPHFKKYLRPHTNFIFFSGGGNVHKGLDLVIEAFMDLPAQLYVVTPLDEAVMSVYKKMGLPPNIHLVEQVEIGSSIYYELFNLCSYAILPSCSEGQPGSILDCMQAGILPIITAECGIDASGGITILSDITVKGVKHAVDAAISISKLKYYFDSQKIRKLALTKHNPQVFDTNLKNALLKITGT